MNDKEFIDTVKKLKEMKDKLEEFIDNIDKKLKELKDKLVEGFSDQGGSVSYKISK